MVVEVEDLRDAGHLDVLAESETPAQLHIQGLKGVAIKIVSWDNGQVGPDPRGAAPQRIDVRGGRVGSVGGAKGPVGGELEPFWHCPDPIETKCVALEVSRLGPVSPYVERVELRRTITGASFSRVILVKHQGIGDPDLEVLLVFALERVLQRQVVGEAVALVQRDGAVGGIGTAKGDRILVQPSGRVVKQVRIYLAIEAVSAVRNQI